MSSSDNDIKQPLNKNFREPKIRFSGFSDLWKKTTIGRNAIVTMGVSPSGETYSNSPSDYVLVQGNADLINRVVKPRIWTTQKTKVANANDIILSVRAPAGVVGKTLQDVVIGRGVAAIQGDDFLYYYLQKYEYSGFWKHIASGSTFESINAKDIQDAMLYVPSDNEKHKIEKTFKIIEQLIATFNNELIALKKYKLGFINNWFETCGNQILLGNLVAQKPSGLLTSHFEAGSGNFPVYDASGFPYTSINFYNTESDSVSIIKYGSGCGRTFLTHGLHSVLGTMNELIPNKSDELYYIYAYTLSNSFKKICKKYTEVGTTPNLYYSDYSLAHVYYPEKDKINKFTQVFVALEKLEALLNSDAKILNYFKSFLLNNMFI